MHVKCIFKAFKRIASWFCSAFLLSLACREHFNCFFSLHSVGIKKDTIKFSAGKRKKYFLVSLFSMVGTHTRPKQKTAAAPLQLRLFTCCLFFSLLLSLRSIQRHNDWINKNDRSLNRIHLRRFPKGFPSDWKCAEHNLRECACNVYTTSMDSTIHCHKKEQALIWNSFVLPYHK